MSRKFAQKCVSFLMAFSMIMGSVVDNSFMTYATEEETTEVTSEEPVVEETQQEEESQQQEQKQETKKETTPQVQTQEEETKTLTLKQELVGFDLENPVLEVEVEEGEDADLSSLPNKVRAVRSFADGTDTSKFTQVAFTGTLPEDYEAYGSVYKVKENTYRVYGTLYDKTGWFSSDENGNVNGYVEEVGITWDSSSVDTSKVGEYTVTSTISGYSIATDALRATVTVKEKDSDKKSEDKDSDSDDEDADTSKKKKKAPKANANDATTNESKVASSNIADHITNDSYVQFTYAPTTTSSTRYTVTYSNSIPNINTDGDTQIQDRQGNDLDAALIKSLKAKLNFSFDDDEIITTDQEFTYTLPTATGLTWAGLSETNLVSEDKTVLGTYRVEGNKLIVKFNEDFIGLNNRFAGIELNGTFDSSKYDSDTDVRFEFEAIGDFVAQLKLPKYLDIVKRDSMVEVDEDSDLADIFANHYRTNGSGNIDGSNYPRIELTDDGQYITQILKVTVTGDQNNVVISDYYGRDSNYWKYDSTIALAKVSKDKTVTKLSETDYTLTKDSSNVYWTLSSANDGDVIYVAYKTKYDGRKNSSSTLNNNQVIDDDNVENKDSTRVYTREYDTAYVKSDEVTQKSSNIDNYLYYYGVSKACINLDTVNKEATWVIYYNLGSNFTKLDGINIKDQAGTGTTLNLIDDSVNVQLLETGDKVEYISSAKVRDSGTSIVTDGTSSRTGWENFTSQFMTSSGFTIPEGTGYGALRIEFKTKYEGNETSRGDSSKITNNAYWANIGHGTTITIGDTGNAYPAGFTKAGQFAANENGVSDWHTGLIKWTSTFRLDPGMSLEYRDGIGIYQRLALDNEDYPMTITYHDGSPGAETKTMTEYKEGSSTDSDAVYYILTVNQNVDTTFHTSQGTRTNPDFTIKFVDSSGKEVKLDAGNYTITYYTYFSPMYIYNLSSNTYDYGYTSFAHREYNTAWVVYNDGKHYMEASTYVPYSNSMRKGSDQTNFSYTGHNTTIPDELKPKALNELFWTFTAPAMTETTSKIVLTDTFSLNNSTVYSSGNVYQYYRDSGQKLDADRFIVYNGDTKLTSDQYELEETTNGFKLTLTKANGYDPTKSVKVSYMTTIPTESMSQGETHYYGNQVRLSEAYDDAMEKLTGNETKFLGNGSSYYYNGDGQKFTYEILSKGDDYDASNQYITYTLDVNKYELDLNKQANTVELTDEMDDFLEYDVDDDGNFIVPIQVLDDDGNALSSDQYTVELGKKTNDDGTVSYGPLKITVPDQKHLTIKYRVRVKSGTKPSDPTKSTMDANNSVRFSTGDYTDVEASDKVTLVGLNSAVGGTPVYLTVQKSDSTDENLLLDGAKYNVTIYKRDKDSNGNWTLTQTDTLEGVTKNGIFTIKTSNQRVIKVEEVTAPTGYTIDDPEPHYYIIERSTEGTKDELKEKYSNTFLKDVDWDEYVDLFNTERPKASFSDTPIEVVTYDHDEFTLTKLDEEDEKTAIEGATYTIYSDEKATKPIQIDGNDVTLTTDENGQFTFSTETFMTEEDEKSVPSDLLPASGKSVTYYVKESSNPAGYELSDTVRSFTISASTKSGWAEDHSQIDTKVTYTIKTDDDDSKKMDVTDSRVRKEEVKNDSVTITKQDVEDESSIKGAEFTLYDEDGNAVKTYTTDASGQLTISTSDKDLASAIPTSTKDTSDETKEFTLKETKAPAGYKSSDKEYKVTISLKSSTEWTGEGSERTYLTTRTYSIDASSIEDSTISNTRKRDSKRVDADVTLTKQDVEDESSIKGAEFTLYDGETVVKTYTTDENGEISISTSDDDLASVIPTSSDDTYDETKSFTLKETKAPDGYQASDVEYGVNITLKNSSDWSGSGDNRTYLTTKTYSIEVTGTDNSVISNARNRETKVVDADVTLTKQDVEDQAPLENAEFTLYDGEEEIKTYTTDENGQIKIDTTDEDLASVIPTSEKDTSEVEKTLTLKETKAPDGYQLSDTEYKVTITLTSDSAWTGEGSKRTYLTTRTYTIDVDGVVDNVISNARKRSSERIDHEVTLNKVDAESEDVLEDAQFTLYADEDCTEEVKTFVTDEEGNFIISTDDQDLVDVLPSFEEDVDDASESITLYLKETKAPKGYALEATVYQLEVNVKRSSDWSGEGDERIFLTTTDYALSFDGNEALSVTNNRVRTTKVNDDSIEVVKVDASNNQLSGAEFTLYADEAGTKTIKTFTAGRAVISTDDADLEAYLPQFDEGTDEGEAEATIYLKETKAPDGYTADDTVYAIDMKATRTSQWDENHEEYLTTTTYEMTVNDSDSIKVVNEKTETAAKKKRKKMKKILTSLFTNVQTWIVLALIALLGFFGLRRFKRQ